MKRICLFLSLLPLLSCGIKADTMPLLEPSYQVKRIGSSVYFRPLDGSSVAQGFRKEGSLYVKEEERPFCFKITRQEGKTRKECLPEAPKEKPLLIVEEGPSQAIIKAQGFTRYYIYREPFDPFSGEAFEGKTIVRKDYVPVCFLVTGEIRPRVESSPERICLKAIPLELKDVQRLEYVVDEKNIYILWSYEADEHFEAFVVYKDGKKVATLKGYMFVDERPNKETIYTVKVLSKYGTESRGVSITYRP
ncbi:hypothetical protein [Thermocrinis minervae]|uniref:Lipoprotein n=1 Tax=Thermocrinis minervae TaxID=381751 RepID=A0A1M6QW87_9AQUI|nr:hypothetical protein [Thermocrinis minervae]SHK24337.1 hypothetical protein SAMN05444391_0418 [Thermocrinis minervae]